jgi:hypothetical protein
MDLEGCALEDMEYVLTITLNANASSSRGDNGFPLGGAFMKLD